MSNIQPILPDEVIMNKILIIRNQKVMVYSDIVELYWVTTKNSIKR